MSAPVTISAGNECNTRQCQGEIITIALCFTLSESEIFNLFQQQFLIARKRSRLNVHPAFCIAIDVGRIYHRYHHRRAADSNRARHDRKWIEFVELAVPRNLFLGKKRLQHLKCFIKSFLCLNDWDPKTFHLKLIGTSTYAKQQPLLGENVCNNNLPCKNSHVVQRQHHDRSNDFHILGVCCNLDSKLQRGWHHQTVDQMMLSHGNGFES